ncbi:MAG: hypothetical protein ABJB11_09930 [Ferruginibacter sp.]
MKIYVTLVLSLLLCTVTKAQKIKADWIEKVKSVASAYKDYQYDKSLPSGDGSFISVYKSFGKLDIKFLKFSEGLELQKEYVFVLNKVSFFGRASMSYSDFVKIDNKYFIVLEDYVKKEKTKVIYFQELDVKTLALTGDAKKVATFDVTEDADAPIRFDYSIDTTKLLVYYEPELNRKANKFMQLVTLNMNLEKIVESGYDFGKPFKQVLVSNISIDDDGSIYITTNTYEKDFDKNFIKTDGDKIPSYVTELVIVDNKNKTTYKINNQGKFIHQLTLANNFNEAPVFTGLYKETHNGRITGAFKATLDKSKKEVAVNFSPFDESLLSLVEQDGWGKAKGSKSGIDNEFFVRHVVSVSNGYIYMISEYHDYIFWGDLIVSTFSPNGKVTQTRIPKNQRLDGTPYGAFSWEKWKYYGYSFSTTYRDDKLLIFYNDKPSNLEKDSEKKSDVMSNLDKSSYVTAIISQNGQLEKREEIFSHKDMNKYITSMNLCRLNDSKIVVIGIKGGTFSDSIKMGILTIN